MSDRMEPKHEKIREALLDGHSASSDREVEFFVESELIEDYLEGSLSEAESERFHRNFLVTDERRELLNEVRMLKRYSSGSYAFDAASIEGTDEATTSRTKWTPLVIILIVAVVLLMIWWATR